MSDNNEQQEPVDENKLIAERRQKLAGIREADGAAFPNDFRRNVMAGELQAEYGEKDKDEIAELNIRVSVAGRMMLKRVMGKASFATVQDDDASENVGAICSSFCNEKRRQDSPEEESRE